MQGSSIIELVLVLALMAVALSVVAPRAQVWVDRAAVSSVREDLIGRFSEARARARRDGGASLSLWREPPRYRVVSRQYREEGQLVSGDGVSIDLGASADSVVLHFDPMGLGRFTNRTIRLRRGRAASTVVVSAYGRVRRQ
jgi:Tfp pilus assembly protein FimT